MVDAPDPAEGGPDPAEGTAARAPDATTEGTDRQGRRPGIAESLVATGRGDDGTTGLLFGGRIAKDDSRTEAYGTVDEVVAALGVARAELRALADAGRSAPALADLADVILRLQRELFVVAAELAANPDAADRLRPGVSRVDETMLGGLEALLRDAEAGISMPREFVVPGESRLSAALEVARTVLRRAERRVIALQREGSLGASWLVPYLNRLADLLWVLARAAEHAEERSATPARRRQP